MFSNRHIEFNVLRVNSKIEKNKLFSCDFNFNNNKVLINLK